MRTAFIARAFTYMTAFALKYHVFIGSYERCLQKAFERTEILSSDTEKSALSQDEGTVCISHQQKSSTPVRKEQRRSTAVLCL